MKKKNKILITLIQIVLIVVIIFSGIKIIEWIKSNKKNKDIMSEIKENVVINNEMDSNNEEYKIDFAKLKQKNSDAIAWIKVNGTDIDFPVVKGTDNSYYLTHNFDKEKNKAGWIFADYRNKFDGTDKNIIIYGHNMKNGSMFASLKDVIKEEWYNNIKSLAEKYGYAKEVKEFKENPSSYKGHVGDICELVRYAVTGRTMTPDLYEILKLLGTSEIIRRINLLKEN